MGFDFIFDVYKYIMNGIGVSQMKKKLIYTIAVILFIGVGIAAFFYWKNGQSKSSEVGFLQTTAVKEKEDGWVYFIYYTEVPDKPNDDYSYDFDAYNIKHKRIEGYELEIIDSETNEVIDKTTTSLPYLSLNKQAREELDKVEKLLNEKQNQSDITNEELDKLELDIIQQEDVIELYNQLRNKENSSSFQYTYLPEADVIQEEHYLDGYIWQFGYFISQVAFEAVHIELIYEDGSYLSELCEKNEASEEQKELYEEVKEMEQYMKENQTLDMKKFKDKKIGEIEFTRLVSIFNNLENRE